MNDFNLCPVCGSKNIKSPGGRKWLRGECGFDLYNNTAAAVGLLIFDKDKRLLLEKRAKEPRKGFLALPGGFVDFDESAEEACLRECREEIGAEPEAIKYICSFPNTYEYKNITYKTCDLFFEAVLPERAELEIQKGEVTELVRVKFETEEDIKNLPLAFESARKTLLYWYKNRHN